MKKYKLIFISCLIIISLCGCAKADSAYTQEPPSATSTETPTDTATEAPTATVTVEPSPSATVKVTPNQSPEATKICYFIMGGMPEFSQEKNNEWREISKKNIIDFIQNGLDKSKLLPLNDGSKNKETGVMITMQGPEEKAVICQLYLLGGETRDGCWCLYFGAQDRDKNRFIFAGQKLGISGHITLTPSSGDTFTKVMANEQENVYLTGINTDTFETLLNDYKDEAVFPYFTYESNDTFDSFYGRMGSTFANDRDFTEQYFLNLQKCYEVSNGILQYMNLVDQSILNESDANLEGNNSIDISTLPIIDSDNLNQVDDLFDRFPASSFPYVGAIITLNH